MSVIRACPCQQFFGLRFDVAHVEPGLLPATGRPALCASRRCMRARLEQSTTASAPRRQMRSGEEESPEKLPPTTRVTSCRKRPFSVRRSRRVCLHRRQCSKSLVCSVSLWCAPCLSRMVFSLAECLRAKCRIVATVAAFPLLSKRQTAASLYFAAA